MPEKTDLSAVLKDQQFHLRRLLETQLWMSKAPGAALDELEIEIQATKAVLAELEQLIAHQKAKSREH